MKVITPNKHRNDWIVPEIEQRSRGTILTGRHCPTILAYRSTNCKEQKYQNFGGALMILQDGFPFGTINNHLFLIKWKQRCVISGGRWYLIWRWLYMHSRAIILDHIRAGMSGM